MMMKFDLIQFIPVLFMLFACMNGEETDLCSAVTNLYGNYKCYNECNEFFPSYNYDRQINFSNNCLVIYAANLNSSSQLYDDLVSISNQHQNRGTFQLLISESKLGNLESSLPSQFASKLEYLFIDDCEINIVSAFESMRKSGISLQTLKFFGLYKLTLTELDENLFIDMPNLKDLCLCNVNLMKVDEKDIAPVANTLERIELCENKLNSIPEALLILKKIKRIYLRNNPIELTRAENEQVVERLVTNTGLKVLEIEIKDCPCSLTSTTFFKSVKENNIRGVYCLEPPSVRLMDFSALKQQDFCNNESSSLARIDHST